VYIQKHHDDNNDNQWSK